MDWTLSAAALNGLLAGLQAAQLALRAALHALGLAPDIHGQPAWPFDSRMAGELLMLDAGHARRLVALAACLGLAMLALAVSMLWRRARPGLWALALGALLLAPWPAPHLLLAPAVPTSFHAAQGGFTADGIVRGQAVYAQHCLRCHGADGRGEGPDAPALPMWPPTLNGALLWKRLEGELFWRVRHGMQGRDGRPTMPGFERQLSERQVWEVLDFLQAQAAGQTLRESGAWAYPVRLPDGPVRCLRGQRPTARSLAGQRVRLAALDAAASAPAGDPRLVTLQLRLPAPGAGANAADADADRGAAEPGHGAQPDCEMAGTAATASLALVLDVPAAQLPGHQVMVDRQGWLRAVSRPGRAGWSEDDLVCRSGAGSAANASGAPGTPGVHATAGDGLDGLIRRMDAEPVRLLRGGFPH